MNGEPLEGQTAGQITEEVVELQDLSVLELGDIRRRTSAAMVKMPFLKQGMIIGAGEKARDWKTRGWKTADLFHYDGMTNVGDANYIHVGVRPKSMDFVVAEFVRMDPKWEQAMGWKGVGWDRLVQQANWMLKPNGILVVKTAAIEGDPEATLPPKPQYPMILQAHGFKTAMVAGPREIRNGVASQWVDYYGKKVRETVSPVGSERRIIY